ncbi:laccase-4 [Hibiscus syriacus]|uniref:Laccase-4 n=1 Tax=Hibiscus syriacus TaxID=106335 RepID=A0A6A3CW52_HIBSY|nr:laccase-4 [Hibiscus syriacus]
MVSGAGKPPLEEVMPSDWAETVDRFQQAALDSRLGIPLAYGIDAVHDLAQRIGSAVALEVRASGIHFNFAPCVAVCRDPRWGRCYESFGEDTKIVRKMTSIITGLQGQPPVGHVKGYPFVAGRYNVIACAKHFVGDGGTENGSFNSYASYSSWNGCKLHAHQFLLTEILKDKLGFKGFLISNWKALDRLSEPRGSNYRHCVFTAISAGIDMVMVPHRYKQFIEDLTSLVESGEIKMSMIDDAVERILRVKIMDHRIEEEKFEEDALMKIPTLKLFKILMLHRELAREAVRKSLVLLKNGNNPGKPFLPLEKNAKKILIAGTHADDLGYQEVIGEKTEVLYEKYPSPSTLAESNFSFAIVAVGEEPYAESAGDNSELVIPLNGSELISTIADRIPTLVILISGRPLLIEPWLLEKMDALNAAWLPGTEGRGITDVVFGDYEFEGRLPMTWFRTTKQLPINNGDNSCDPLFPLGFGLTFN